MAYLGHLIDSTGIYTLPSKLNAIQDAPEPQDVGQLCSFLGLLNYYGKFISNLSTLLHPFNQLLKTNTKWEWDSDCVSAFAAAKSTLMSSSVLVHFDPKLSITLAGDASSYGIGAAISHIYPDGSERPIAFASRTLNRVKETMCNLKKRHYLLLLE